MKMSISEILVAIIAGALISYCTIMLLTEDSYAEDYATAAVGVFNSGKNSHAETKFANLGHRGDLGLGLTYQLELGGWVDTTGHGRASSAYGAAQFGVETDGEVFARVMTGPALITNPDWYLGGPFAFTEDFYLGLRGRNGNSVGLLYKHISNAGIYNRNVGRDLAGVQVSIPF